jgi:hypothetical protein
LRQENLVPQEAYGARIRELDGVIADVTSRGPTDLPSGTLQESGGFAAVKALGHCRRRTPQNGLRAMPKIRSPLASLLSLTAAAVVGPAGANAIECQEDFQIVNGQPISTPYCRDAYLAQVAREHGFNTSAEVMRNNPARKEEICRYIGSDIRAQPACADVLPEGRDTR